MISKKLTIEWRSEGSGTKSLIWRIPDENFSKVSDIKEVIVKEHERVLILSSGTIKRFLPPGRYEISKDVTDVIWVDVSPKTCPFGIRKSSNALLTADGKVIGISGTITLRVKGDEGSVRLFFLKVVTGQKCYTFDQLVEWLSHGILVSVLHDVIAKIKSDDFGRVSRAELGDKILAGLSEELAQYGIEATSVHIVGIAGL